MTVVMHHAVHTFAGPYMVECITMVCTGRPRMYCMCQPGK
jgi:hypothetical protein